MALTDTIKKIPTPVWLGLGGAAVGLGVVALKGRQEPAPEVPPVGEGDALLTDEYGLEPYSPTAVGPVYAAPSVEPAETVGAVGQTGLETIGDFFTGFIEGLPELIGSIREPYDGVPQSQPPQVIIQQPVTPGPSPAPSPAPGPAPHAANKPASYASGPPPHARGSVSNGATGHKEITTPDTRFRDFHVSYGNHTLKRWRWWATGAHVPKAKRDTWDLIWTGRW